MIQVESRVDIKDNSGAIIVGCIRCLKGSKKNSATVGDWFVSSVKKNIIRKKKRPVLKGNIYKCVLVSSKKSIKRFGNFYIKSSVNGGVLVNAEKSPISSRVFGPTFKDVRKQNLAKILSISDFIV